MPLTTPKRGFQKPTATDAVSAHQAAIATALDVIDNMVDDADSRLTNARTPTGAAGGVLSGTYPNPGFASDMVTQVELDAHVNDTTAAHAASAVSFAPTGTVASTDVQSAIAEVAAEAGGSSLVVQDEGSSLATAATTFDFRGRGVKAEGTGATKTITVLGPTKINALDFETASGGRDGLLGDGTAETVARLNAFKAVLDGKIVNFPPAPDYNLANILGSTGGGGFVFTKPTEFRGPGQGEDQAVGGQTVGRLIFPAGCHFIEIQGTGAGGGAAGSRLIDLFLKGPVAASGSAEDFDGVRVRAYDFYARGVRVEGVGRDGWNFDTNASSNANMSLLETCSAWFCRRNGLYGVGTNTNVLNLQTFKANNNGAYTTTSGSHVLPVATLNVASGGTRDFRTGGGTFTFTASGVQYRGSYMGKSGNTLTGVTWPGAVSTMTLPAGTGISSGFGLYLGGAATPGTDPYGGATCTVTAFHGSFNAEGAIMDNGSSNLYQNPYEEATNATYPHSWRFVIGPDSVFGGLWAPKFGGYPVYNLSALATGTYSFDRKANDGWDIRQPVPYGFESTPRASGAMVITGSKGGNAAVTSMIAGLVNAGRAVDETT